MAFVNLGFPHSGDATNLAIETVTFRYTNGLEMHYTGKAAENCWNEYQFGLFLKLKAVEEQQRMQAMAEAATEEKEDTQTANSEEFSDAMKKHAERVK